MRARSSLGSVISLVVLTACVGNAVKVPPAVPNAGPSGCPNGRAQRTTFVDASGICLPSRALSLYRCSSDVAPVLVRFGGGANERRYLGGAYAVPVERIPADAREIGRSPDGGRIYGRTGAPEWVWVQGASGISRWLQIPRRPTWTALGAAPTSPSPAGSSSATVVTSGVAATVAPVSDPPSAFFIGDSITDGASTFIPAALPGWTTGFDAVVGRGSASGVSPAQIQAATDPPPDAIVLELGTNDQDVEAFRANARAMLESVRGIPLILWQTVHGDVATRPAVNAAIRELVADHPNAALSDWASFVTKDEMSSDGVHPAADHEDLMALLVGPLLQGWREAVEGVGATECLS